MDLGRSYYTVIVLFTIIYCIYRHPKFKVKNSIFEILKVLQISSNFLVADCFKKTNRIHLGPVSSLFFQFHRFYSRDLYKYNKKTVDLTNRRFHNRYTSAYQEYKSELKCSFINNRFHHNFILLKASRLFNDRKTSKFLVNEEIKSNFVRLIDSTGEKLGVVPIEDARKKAREEQSDLVEVCSGASPPICRIIDIKKFLYENEKLRKSLKKKQKSNEVKEIRLSVRIDVHDFNVKMANIIKFLNKQKKVKVSVILRGRERANIRLGIDMLKNVENALKDISKSEEVQVINPVVSQLYNPKRSIR